MGCYNPLKYEGSKTTLVAVMLPSSYYNPLKCEGSKTKDKWKIHTFKYYNPLKYEGSKTSNVDCHAISVYYNPLKYEGRYTLAVGGLYHRTPKIHIKTGKIPRTSHEVRGIFASDDVVKF